MKLTHYLAAILIMGWAACSGTNKAQREKESSFSWQAHRGGRGLMPENTIPAMQHAIALGANTLELDVLITRDNKVVVSHDPYFNDLITTSPEGQYLSKKDANERLLYSLTYDSIRKYDVGMKPYPEFPRQVKMAARKPLLAELIDASEAYAKSLGKTIGYNIEIKSNERFDGIRHPDVKSFVELVVSVIAEKKITRRVTLQSFDVRPLQYLKKNYPAIKLSYLVDKSAGSFEDQFKKLGFTTEVYSPQYLLVTRELVDRCHKQGMKVIPWTVNTAAEIKSLIDMGVDGVISDYPDLFAPFK